MPNYASVGQCPTCSQGRQLIARENDTQKLYVVCEECESEWQNPEDARAKRPASRDLFGRSTYLTREDLVGHPWEGFLEK